MYKNLRPGPLETKRSPLEGLIDEPSEPHLEPCQIPQLKITEDDQQEAQQVPGREEVTSGVAGWQSPAR